MAIAFFIKRVENLFCKVKIFEIVFNALMFLVEKSPGQVLLAFYVLQSLY